MDLEKTLQEMPPKFLKFVVEGVIREKLFEIDLPVPTDWEIVKNLAENVANLSVWKMSETKEGKIRRIKLVTNMSQAVCGYLIPGIPSAVLIDQNRFVSDGKIQTIVVVNTARFLTQYEQVLERSAEAMVFIRRMTEENNGRPVTTKDLGRGLCAHLGVPVNPKNGLTFLSQVWHQWEAWGFVELRKESGKIYVTVKEFPKLE